jgi:hypothetical protein
MLATTLRLEKYALQRIQQLAKKKYLDKGTYMRQLVMKQLEQEVLNESIEEYKQKKISIEELAKRNNRSLVEILDIFKQRNITLNVDLADVIGGVEV